MRTLKTIFLIASLTLVVNGCYNINHLRTDDLASDNASLHEAKYRYYQSLMIPNVGVQESAMMNIVKMKLMFPQEDFTQIREKVASMVLNSRDKQVRNIAFLTNISLHNPGCLSGNDYFIEIKESGQFYSIVSRKINNYIAAIRQ